MKGTPEKKVRFDAEIRTREDGLFKYFIHKPRVLAMILKTCAEEFAVREVDEIAKYLIEGSGGDYVKGRETEYIDENGSKAILDSVFDLTVPSDDGEIPLLVGIEGQNDPYPGYPLEKRAEYYIARMVSAQKGREFSGSDYGGLRKTYSIWIVLDPNPVYRNTVFRSKTVRDAIFAPDGVEPPVMETYNIVFVNIGEYAEGLPDALAIGTALFSAMDTEERRKLLRERFNIVLNDNDLERLEEMSTIGKDKYEHGYRDGIQIGIDQERKNSICAMADIIMSARQKNDSLEQSMARIPISADYRSEVEAEVRRRLS